MEYVFTSGVTELEVPIAIHNDNVLNGERRFFLNIPALSLVDRGGLHAREVIPYHLEAYIQDDEGIKVVIGSTFHSVYTNTG
jgi:hypothetical protein